MPSFTTGFEVMHYYYFLEKKLGTRMMPLRNFFRVAACPVCQVRRRQPWPIFLRAQDIFAPSAAFACQRGHAIDVSRICEKRASLAVSFSRLLKTSVNVVGLIPEKPLLMAHLPQRKKRRRSGKTSGAKASRSWIGIGFSWTSNWATIEVAEEVSDGYRWRFAQVVLRLLCGEDIEGLLQNLFL